MINRALYFTAPRLDLDQTSTLATTLASAVKPSHPDNLRAVAAELQRLVGIASNAQLAQSKQLNTPSAKRRSSVEIDTATDQAWRALRYRLEALTFLPADQDLSVRAQLVLQRIFGNEGTEFLKLPYPAQLNQMKLRMAPIDGDADGQHKEPGLAKEIDRLAGPEILANIRAQMADYEAMVSAAAKTTPQSSEPLTPILRQLQDRIVHFSIVVLGNSIPDDEASEAAALALLAPIDNAKAKLKSSARKAPMQTQEGEMETDAEEPADA